MSVVRNANDSTGDEVCRCGLLSARLTTRKHTVPIADAGIRRFAIALLTFDQLHCPIAVSTNFWWLYWVGRRVRLSNLRWQRRAVAPNPRPARSFKIWPECYFSIQHLKFVEAPLSLFKFIKLIAKRLWHQESAFEFGICQTFTKKGVYPIVNLQILLATQNVSPSCLVRHGQVNIYV